VRAHLAGLGVLWAGVRCAPEVAAAREAARGDRVRGAALKATIVHEGVRYDVEVDTSDAESLACARVIASCVAPVHGPAGRP
jgi:chloramphenicol 3-O phosphotransferase